MMERERLLEAEVKALKRLLADYNRVTWSWAEWQQAHDQCESGHAVCNCFAGECTPGKSNCQRRAQETE